MWGHSGGGFITADALLRAPYNDFFKVGIAESGNHDQRQYEDDWGERYQGPLVKNPDGTDNYAIEATQTQAAGLKGHLLLIHGTMDNNVPPYNTLLVADALIKANKEFDMLLIPNSGHGYRAGELRHAAALGLLREVPARRRAAAGLRDSVRAGGRRQTGWRPPPLALTLSASYGGAGPGRSRLTGVASYGGAGPGRSR